MLHMKQTVTVTLMLIVSLTVHLSLTVSNSVNAEKDTLELASHA